MPYNITVCLLPCFLQHTVVTESTPSGREERHRSWARGPVVSGENSHIACTHDHLQSDNRRTDPLPKIVERPEPADPGGRRYHHGEACGRETIYCRDRLPHAPDCLRRVAT